MPPQIPHTNLIVLFLPLLPHHQRPPDSLQNIPHPPRNLSLPIHHEVHHPHRRSPEHLTPRLSQDYLQRVCLPSLMTVHSVLLTNFPQRVLPLQDLRLHQWPANHQSYSHQLRRSPRHQKQRRSAPSSMHLGLSISPVRSLCSLCLANALTAQLRLPSLSDQRILQPRDQIQHPRIHQEYIDQERGGADTSSWGVRCGRTGRSGSDCYDLNE